MSSKSIHNHHITRSCDARPTQPNNAITIPATSSSRRFRILHKLTLPPAETTTCAICQSELLVDMMAYQSGKTDLALVSCGHKFHRTCMREWMRNCKSKNCPLCRRESEYDPCNFSDCISVNYFRPSRSLNISIKEDSAIGKTKKMRGATALLARKRAERIVNAVRTLHSCAQRTYNTAKNELVVKRSPLSNDSINKSAYIFIEALWDYIAKMEDAIISEIVSGKMLTESEMVAKLAIKDDIFSLLLSSGNNHRAAIPGSALRPLTMSPRTNIDESSNDGLHPIKEEPHKHADVS